MVILEPSDVWVTVVRVGTPTTAKLLSRLLNIRGRLLNAAFNEFSFHFGFLSSEQTQFCFKCPITGQPNLDSMFSGANQHRANAAELTRMSDVLVIEKHRCASRVDV